MLKYGKFIKENTSEIDPYGEEEWDYDNIWINAPDDYKFQQGEEIRLRPEGFYANRGGINAGLVGRAGFILNKPKKRTWPEAFEWDVRFDNGNTRNYRTIDLMCKRKNDQVLERRIPYKKTLCPDIWESGVIIERIKIKLIKIAKDFYNDVELETEIKDIYLTGSMANYNYNDESDIDVHVVIDYSDVNEDTELVKKAIDGQRFIWNLRHNITIKGHDVELYIQDEKEEHCASGLYSLMNDKWIIKPVYNPPDVDTKDVNIKYEARVYDINKFEKLSKMNLTPEESDEYYNGSRDLKAKIMKSRKEGLTEEGEFSIENLVFKKLRKEGKIKKLIDIITRFYDKIYSQ